MLSPSVLSHKQVVYQNAHRSNDKAHSAGNGRSPYQGMQRGQWSLCAFPKGAAHKACGRVAVLDKGYGHCLRTAPCHRPCGPR